MGEQPNTEPQRFKIVQQRRTLFNVEELIDREHADVRFDVGIGARGLLIDLTGEEADRLEQALGRLRVARRDREAGRT